MKRNTPVWIYLSLALLSLLLLLGTAGACYSTLFGGKRARYVTLRVPQLVGCAWDECVLPEGFYSSTTYVYDTAHPAGTVLFQSPAPHTERTVRQGQPIVLRVSVSLGKQQIEIPDLCGTDVRQAEQRLRSQGLRVRCHATYPSDPAVDGYTVTAQSVAAGSTLPIGSEITLTYASPKKIRSARVPSLIGLDRRQANTALLRAGLIPGNVTYADGATEQDPCTVTMQEIPDGSLVPIGTTIHYTLSRTVIPWNIPFAEESSKESADFIT